MGKVNSFNVNTRYLDFQKEKLKEVLKVKKWKRTGGKVIKSWSQEKSSLQSLKLYIFVKIKLNTFLIN